jgi:hypothetical protein
MEVRRLSRKERYNTGGRGKEVTSDHPTHSRPHSQRFPFVFTFKETSGQKLHEDEEVKSEVTTWLRAQAAEFYDIGIQKLLPRLNK